jgi:hypothetical protein
MNVFLIYPWSSSVSDYIDDILKENDINFEVQHEENDIWKYTFNNTDEFKIKLLIKKYNITPLILNISP